MQVFSALHNKHNFLYFKHLFIYNFQAFQMGFLSMDLRTVVTDILKVPSFDVLLA